jgi:hypothetical protein
MRLDEPGKSRKPSKYGSLSIIVGILQILYHDILYAAATVKWNTYIRTYMHAYIHTYMHKHTCMHTRIHNHTRTHTHILTNTHTHTHTYTHTHTHTHAYTHTHSRIHIHIHTHTYTHSFIPWIQMLVRLRVGCFTSVYISFTSSNETCYNYGMWEEMVVGHFSVLCWNFLYELRITRNLSQGSDSPAGSRTGYLSSALLLWQWRINCRSWSILTLEGPDC